MEKEGDEAVDAVRTMADPLFFGEDEEPIGGDLGKPPCTQQSEPVIEDVRRYEPNSESTDFFVDVCLLILFSSEVTVSLWNHHQKGLNFVRPPNQMLDLYQGQLL